MISMELKQFYIPRKHRVVFSGLQSTNACEYICQKTTTFDQQLRTTSHIFKLTQNTELWYLNFRINCDFFSYRLQLIGMIVVVFHCHHYITKIRGMQ